MNRSFTEAHRRDSPPPPSKVKVQSVRKRGGLVVACGACAACDGFGFARNTTTTFDVFYWLQVTNFDVRLLNSAPNGPDYIDIVGLCLHAQLFS
jgi:hypothetical protein